MLTQIADRLDGLEKGVREVATEQVLLGNRIENAFSRALRADIRIDAIEDRKPTAP